MREMKRKVVSLEEKLQASRKFPIPGIIYVQEFRSPEELTKLAREIEKEHGVHALEHVLFVGAIKKPPHAGR